MKIIEKIIKYIGSLLDKATCSLWLCAGVLITLMAFVTGYGVIMRYIFKNPDPYAYEITYILMLSCVMFSLAHTQRLNRHLKIDIMDRYFSEGIREFIANIIGPVVGLIFCIPLIMKTWDKALFALESGQTSGTTGILVFPMMFLIPIGSGLLGLVLVAQMLRYLFSLRNKNKPQEK
jgi:TRAP-type C4-dicarboxylate transport system permease small subunit